MQRFDQIGQANGCIGREPAQAAQFGDTPVWGDRQSEALLEGVHVLDQVASSVTRGFVEFIVHALRLRIEIGAGTLVE